MLTPLESRVLSRVDSMGIQALLSELVRIPSLGGEETPIQRRVAAWMTEVGFDVDVWDLDLMALRAHPAYSAEIERAEGIGVVGSLGEGVGGRSLILNGHVDVVPPGDLDAWSFPPWDGGIEDGHLRGRGALDMKGGLVAGFFAAKAIMDAGVRLEGKLLLQSVIGEEDGGLGTLAAVERGYRADGAVIMEPTDLAICPAQAGALNFRIRVRGKSAHGCVRDEGVSALEKYRVVQDALVALEARRNHYCSDPLFEGLSIPFPISVGRIEGGDWASSVPDWVVAEGRYGVLPDEDLEIAKVQFSDAVADAGESDDWLREHPPEIEWWGGRFKPALVSLDDPVVRELRAALQDLGKPSPSLRGVPYGSDMRLLVHEGRTPAVLFGPGNIRKAHAADESVAMDDVELAAKTLALTALRFCGHVDG